MLALLTAVALILVVVMDICAEGAFVLILGRILTWALAALLAFRLIAHGTTL
jgi:hypothetical protein